MRTRNGKRTLLRAGLGAGAVLTTTVLTTTVLWAGPAAAQEGDATLESVAEANALTQAILDNLWLVVAGSLLASAIQAGRASRDESVEAFD